MKSHFKVELHPAMEQTITQMTGIAQRMKNYEKAIDMTGAIVQIRINEHGSNHDGVLVPLIKIATFQKILQQDDLMVETCRKGIEHATLCLKNEDSLENDQVLSSVKKFLMEFYQMLCHQLVTMQDVNGVMEATEEYIESSKAASGPMSDDHAYAIYLKAKAQHSDKDTMKRQALQTIRKCLTIWKNTPQTGQSRDLNHVLALLLKASILESEQLKKYREAIKVFRKAAYMATEIKRARMNVQTLVDNITDQCEKVITKYEK